MLALGFSVVTTVTSCPKALAELKSRNLATSRTYLWSPMLSLRGGRPNPSLERTSTGLAARLSCFIIRLAAKPVGRSAQTLGLMGTIVRLCLLALFGAVLFGAGAVTSARKAWLQPLVTLDIENRSGQVLRSL